MKRWLINIVEKILMVFLGRKAEKERALAVMEIDNAIAYYQKAKEKNDKYIKRYSGSKKFVKTGRM